MNATVLITREMTDDLEVIQHSWPRSTLDNGATRQFQAEWDEATKVVTNPFKSMKFVSKPQDLTEDDQQYYVIIRVEIGELNTEQAKLGVVGCLQKLWDPEGGIAGQFELIDELPVLSIRTEVV